MSEAEREQKQTMLYEQIIEAGYDATAFQVYCETIKENGSQDIDLWTVPEMTKLISDFRRKEDAQMERLRQQSQSSQLMPEQEGQLNQQQQQQDKPFLVSKNIDDVNFITEVECLLPQRTPLTDYIMENTHKQVEILMTEFMTKSEGLFSTGFGAFKVETTPIGWCVWRRFSDFQKLRDVLQKSFPQHLIPPIPGKKLKVKGGTDSEYLEKRMRVMELFLQNCLYHPLIKTHPAFSDFLSLTDDAKLKEKYQTYEKMKGPSKPSEYTSTNGACVLEISQDVQSYSQSLSAYLKNSTEIYKKLGHNFKKLFVDLDTLSSTLLGISENFNSLERVTDNFSKTSQNKAKGEVQQIQQVYQELSKFMLGWQSGVQFQMKNVKENFYEFFRYHKKTQQTASDFVALRNQLQQKFNEQKSKLTEKKEKLYIVGDTSKWELPADIPKTIKELQVNKGDAFKYMLPNDTRQLNDLRDTFAFLNHQLTDEVNQMMDFRIKVYASKFVRVAQMRALETAKLHHTLANFLQALTEMQGSSSGCLQNRKASVFIDGKYDSFFGIKK